MFRFICFILGFLCFLIPRAVWGYEVSFSGGTHVLVTGENEDITFNGISAIINQDASVGVPVFDTQNGTLSGGFYIKNIGWASFATGSYQVLIPDCNETKIICPLVGTGWSDKIGELSMSNVTYGRVSQTLSGSIHTAAGAFSVDGIRIASGPVNLNASSFQAHHQANITVTAPNAYMGKILTIKVTNRETNSAQQYGYSHAMGAFTGVDISMAGLYDFEITVKNPLISSEAIEWITHLKNVTVTPGNPTGSLVSGNYALKTYCTSNGASTRCPDGSTLQATSLTTTNASVLADGATPIEYTLKLRDAYGNRASSGSVRVAYNNVMKRVQIDELDNIALTTQNGPALQSAQIDPSIFTPTAEWDFIYTPTSDISYSLHSTAPGTLSLSGITWNGHLITGLIASSPIFTPPWTASVTNSGVVYTLTPHNFNAILTKNGDHDIENPTLISRFRVQSTPPNPDTYIAIIDPNKTCAQYGFTTFSDRLCNWLLDGSFMAVAYSSFEDGARTLRTFYQTLFPKQKYPIHIDNYIHYLVNSHDILYRTNSAQIAGDDIEVGDIPPIRLLGHSGGLITNSTNARGEFFNSVRKTAQILRRNTTGITTSNFAYRVEDTTTLEVRGGSFDTVQSLIAIGQDVLITENIITNSTKPLAIIALTENGRGGNIVISGSVTDIHASLIADRGVIGTGATDRQLYIFGSLLTTNVFADGECPFFAQDPDKCNEYNVSKLRPDFDNSVEETRSISPVAADSPYTPVIIQSNPNLPLDPPPGLIQID